MFVDFLGVWMDSNKIHPNTVNSRYLTFPGEDCIIRIWYYGKTDICKNGKSLRSFYFNEKILKKYLVEKNNG
jgi:hypothetical protein